MPEITTPVTLSDSTLTNDVSPLLNTLNHAGALSVPIIEDGGVSMATTTPTNVVTTNKDIDHTSGPSLEVTTSVDSTDDVVHVPIIIAIATIITIATLLAVATILLVYKCRQSMREDAGTQQQQHIDLQANEAYARAGSHQPPTQPNAAYNVLALGVNDTGNFTMVQNGAYEYQGTTQQIVTRSNAAYDERDTYTYYTHAVSIDQHEYDYIN